MAIFFATWVVLSGMAPMFCMLDCGSIDMPKLIVTTLPHGELMAVESVSLVAQPVRNTPDGL